MKNLEWVIWRRWLHLNHFQQVAEVTLTGTGVALSRLPLVEDSLDNGDMVACVSRQAAERAHGSVARRRPRSGARLEIQAFCT